MSAPADRARWLQLAALLGLCLLLAACASPVRAVRVDREAARRDLMRGVVTTGEPSWETRDVLLERGLLDAFGKRPADAIAELHRAMVASGGDSDLLFALAELSYLHGEMEDATESYLAAAIYAYAFLFPEAGEPGPAAFDPRLRIAADLYNWSLTAAFASEDGSEVVPRAEIFALPFGLLDVSFDAAELRVGDRELYRFIPVAELEVKGLSARYRTPGIGAPLAASTRRVESAAGGTDMVAPRLQVPLTALLRVEQARRALLGDDVIHSTLELHLAWDGDSVAIEGNPVPLESEPTAALALTFTGIPVVQLELLGFLGRITGIAAERPPLVSTTPYRPGLIPVVFVHGTASSAVRWAELFNRLQADPEIQSRYQFWFFQYDSGNPIALSSLRLRDSLSRAIASLDPDGRDPALRRMVLIGHSQGGLLVKMQSIDSGDEIWNSVSRKPLDELDLSDETRSLLRGALFVEPLPEVSRVIFIATPHRGSFLASHNFVTNLIRRLAKLPLVIGSTAAEMARNRDVMRSPVRPTSVDNMSPGHPFIKGLQAVPVAPFIAAHSIIAVKGTGPVEQGNDGVVEYTSAHIEGVESELVVSSPHSCQGHPQTMEEVRRILRLHVGLGMDGDPIGIVKDRRVSQLP